MRVAAKPRAFGKICVVGCGRWGTSLRAALRSAGVKVEVAESAGDLPEAEMYWLCVPDGSIEAASRRIAKVLIKRCGSMSGVLVVHSSGVTNSDVLSVAEKAGASVGSIHPLMSFPTRKVVSVAGTPFAIEAGVGVRNRLFALVRRLGGKPFTISKEGKALYHAAAVLASPLLVALAEGVRELSSHAGIPPAETSEIFQPILAATLQNYMRAGGEKSFSGPFARGDQKTISLHLDALGAHPALMNVYKSLALYALTALPVANRQKLLRMLKTR